jgi:putative transposase
MAYWRLHYHLIWATYKRLPLIDAGAEQVLYRVIKEKCYELGVILHAVGNIEDHVHVVASIPPKLAVAEILKHFKGASSRAIGELRPHEFKWQEAYGALSLGERSLERVIHYALNQKQHHAARTMIAVYEQISEHDDGPALLAAT